MPSSGIGERSKIDLAVVMPVYNERELIEQTIGSWVDRLGRIGINWRVLAVDDGSTDGTAAMLHELAANHDRVDVQVKANEGHGPTVLRGYRRAVDLAEWVFQVDSDDEIPASEFDAVWAARTGNDAVLGIRTGRSQGAVRWLVTHIARLIVRVLYGAVIRDVNCPFRLMRSSALAPLLARVPIDTFAPNVALTGGLAARGPMAQVPVTYRPRAAGGSSLAGVGVLVHAVTAGLETIGSARRLQ